MIQKNPKNTDQNAVFLFHPVSQQQLESKRCYQKNTPNVEISAKGIT